MDAREIIGAILLASSPMEIDCVLNISPIFKKNGRFAVCVSEPGARQIIVVLIGRSDTIVEHPTDQDAHHAHPQGVESKEGVDGDCGWKGTRQ
jgi:hypothetical protein